MKHVSSIDEFFKMPNWHSKYKGFKIVMPGTGRNGNINISLWKRGIGGDDELVNSHDVKVIVKNTNAYVKTLETFVDELKKSSDREKNYYMTLTVNDSIPNLSARSTTFHVIQSKEFMKLKFMNSDEEEFKFNFSLFSYHALVKEMQKFLEMIKKSQSEDKALIIIK